MDKLLSLLAAISNAFERKSSHEPSELYEQRAAVRQMVLSVAALVVCIALVFFVDNWLAGAENIPYLKAVAQASRPYLAAVLGCGFGVGLIALGHGFWRAVNVGCGAEPY